MATIITCNQPTTAEAVVPVHAVDTRCECTLTGRDYVRWQRKDELSEVTVLSFVCVLLFTKRKRSRGRRVREYEYTHTHTHTLSHCYPWVYGAKLNNRRRERKRGEMMRECVKYNFGQRRRELSRSIEHIYALRISYSTLVVSSFTIWSMWMHERGRTHKAGELGSFWNKTREGDSGENRRSLKYKRIYSRVVFVCLFGRCHWRYIRLTEWFE